MIEWSKLNALKYNGIIWFGILKHAIWCITLLVSVQPFKVSSLYILSLFVESQYLVAGILLSSVVCGLLALYATKLDDTTRVLLLWPQQFVIWTAAGSIIILSLQGHYADGVVRPGISIFIDQIAYVVGAIAHTGTLIMYSWRGKWSLKT